MIYGIGIDLLSIPRMEQAWERHGHRLAERLLAPSELPAFNALPDTQRPRWLAKRWAAKEALAKATGLGMRAPVCWIDMAITHTPEGRPQWHFIGTLADWMAQRQLYAHLTISDERDAVIAQVLLEQRG